jgi:ATPase family associated with various cellular activities (AAA)
MIQQFNAARRASAPIVAISTPDPASTIRSIQVMLAGKPLAQWDIVNGVRSITSTANAAVAGMHTVDGQLMPATMVSSNPVDALRLSTQWLPEDAILFFHNAHFYVEQGPGDAHKPVVQAVWNTRDPWRANRRTLVLMGPGIKLPMELRNDVALIDEALPTDKDMALVVARGVSRANGRKTTRKEQSRLIDAVSGLASFNAEQVIAMSVSPKTRRPNMEEVWGHKIKLIEQARGLKVYRHGASLSQIGGNSNIKNLMLKISKGKRPPRLIVFMDEIEKTMQAAGTDTSGTTTDQLKVLLTKMQDNEWTGFMIYGFAGTGKSQLAKAFGNECGCPTVEADLGSMKNMWVGSSEANMRAFIKVIEAMGGKEVFFVATCNSVVALPPEFKRRFRKGVWFCDLPAAAERKQIWDIYFSKLGIRADSPKPNDEGWTGAEIELCCENSHEFGVSLEEASRFMTITSQAMGDQVENMRMAADGKFINASHPGIYRYVKPQPPAPPDKPKKGFISKLI